MKRYLPLSLIGIIAVAVLLAAATLSSRQPAQASVPKNTGIGQHVAGTYLLGPFPELGTFTADGSYVLTHVAAYGDHPAAEFLSPEHGSWRQTGPRQISSRSLTFAFTEDPENEDRHYHFATVRVDIVWDFDDATFRSGTLTLLATDIFFADQDPLDPEEEPFLSLPGGDTASFRHIEVP